MVSFFKNVKKVFFPKKPSFDDLANLKNVVEKLYFEDATKILDEFEVTYELYRIKKIGKFYIITDNKYIFEYLSKTVFYINNVVEFDPEFAKTINIRFDTLTDCQYINRRYGYTNSVVFPSDSGYGNFKNVYDLIYDENTFKKIFDENKIYYKNCILVFKNYVKIMGK